MSEASYFAAKENGRNILFGENISSVFYETILPEGQGIIRLHNSEIIRFNRNLQTTAEVQAFTTGLISEKTAFRELQGSSKLTGMWTNITDEQINAAADQPEASGEMPIPDMPPMETQDADFKEEKHPRDKSGKFSKGDGSTSSGNDGNIKVDASGSNKLSVRKFRSKQFKINHYLKHGKAMGFKSADEYMRAGVTLLESATSNDILGHADKEGCIIRYDCGKKWFAKGSLSTGIFTFFKPDTGDKYYQEQRMEDLKHGGKR